MDGLAELRSDRGGPPHRCRSARCGTVGTSSTTSCWRAASGCARPSRLPAEHPLFILYSSGSTAKPKGILHTTGGYLTGVAATHRDVFDLRPESDVFWCTADVGWVTGHSYIVYGPLANGCTSVMFEGAPDYPAKDIWWEIIERYGVTIFYTAPTAIRACMKWGVEYPNKHDLSSLRAARLGRRADQPEGLALVPRGGRSRALPGRRHLVADRDRAHHDRAAARRDADQARLGHPPAARHQRRRWWTSDGAELEEGTGLLVITRPWPGMLAHPLRRRRPLRLDVLRPVRAAAPTWSVMRPAATATATSGSSVGPTTSSTCPGTGCPPPRSSPRSCAHDEGRRGGRGRRGRRV